MIDCFVNMGRDHPLAAEEEDRDICDVKEDEHQEIKGPRGAV